MINQRAFGVEIECGSPWSFDYCSEFSEDYGENSPLGKTQKLLENKGLKNWAEKAYYDGTQIEIPSPILRGADGMRQLKEVMNLLNSNDFYTTHEDGMHVHHDTNDLSFDQIQTVAETWYENQNLINQLVARHRRNGSWCRNLHESDLDIIREEAKRGEHLLGRYGDPQHEKYKSLSLYARVEYGTIEIRLHEGTLDFKKAKAWILFGQAFISNIAARKRPVKYASIEEMLDRVRVRPIARATLLSRKEG